MSKSEPPPTEPTAKNGATKRPPRADWIARGMLMAGILLLSGVLLMRELPLWYQAAALEHRDRGEWTQAVESLDRAVAYDDDNPIVYQLRAELTLRAAEAQVAALRAEQQEAGELTPEAADEAAAQHAKILEEALELALADYEKSLGLFAEDINARRNKAEILQRLGRHEEAVAECQQILAEAKKVAAENRTPEMAYELSSVLNTLAYTRARGEVDLEQGLAEINDALILLRATDPSVADPSAEANYLDTRGLILYHLGRYDEALLDLEVAVTTAHRYFSSQERQFDWERQITHDNKTFNLRVQAIRNHLGVLLHHRGQVYQAIGRQDAAERDFEAARRYGYNKEMGVW